MAKDIADALIEESGTLYSEEMDARIDRDTPQELFHWLVGAIMLSARIDAGLAVQGAAALREAGLHTIDALRGAAWEDTVRVLNENGYASYDEPTARGGGGRVTGRAATRRGTGRMRVRAGTDADARGAA